MNLAKAVKVLWIVLLLPAMVWAVEGKIRGFVRDAQTGEPLIGANVQIIGTTLGAATDANGEYIILNIPIGRYTLSASYIGYQILRIENVVVASNQTTFLDFNLTSSVIEGQEVVIVAERPLVNRGATNDVKVIRSETIENLPIRGYANLVGAQVGAVQSGNNIYVRGGRLDEVGYFVDGVLMNSPYNRARTGEVSQNALEEVSYQPGGMSAEFGLFNSGIVSTSTKTGGPELAISGEVLSDQFLAYNDKKFWKGLSLGTYSYGYNLYSLSIGGPVPGTEKKLRFFGNAEYNFMRDRSPRWGPTVKPSVFTKDVKELLKLSPEPVPVSGAKPGNARVLWTGTGNLYYALPNWNFKVGGSLSLDKYRDYVHDYAAFVSENMPKAYRNVYTGYAKATWVINPQAYVEANANYYVTQYEYMDHKHGLNFMDYTDPSKNWNVTEWGQRATPRDEFARFHTYGRVYGGYNKEDMSRWNFKLDGTWQPNKVHELKAGLEAQLNLVRFYNILPWRLSGTLHQLYARNPNPSEAEILNAYRSSYLDNAGYDYLGNEVNSGRDDARRPKIFSGYIQDKMEFRDIIINVGLRIDHIMIAQKQLRDMMDIRLDENGEIPDSELKDPAVYTEINPRLGLSFPITDRTHFYLQYGKYTQPAPFDVTYITWWNLAANLQQGNYTTSPNPGLKPVKTTSYEVGFEQQIGMNAALTVTAFYKEIRDQVFLKNLVGAKPISYTAYVNGDFGNVKGFSFDFRLRRTARVMANVNYTLQWANGTGSDPETQYRIAWQNPDERPTYVAPLDYDQRHTIALNVDFRTKADDGVEVWGVHPFGNVGINVWYTYGSGLAYTPETVISTVFATVGARYPQAAVNSGTRPPTSSLNLRVDKRFSVGPFDLNPYVWVINLLNTKNVLTVYNATNQPDNDGYLATVEGQRWAEANPLGAKWYYYRTADPENYGEPRQIRVGLRVDFK